MDKKDLEGKIKVFNLEDMPKNVRDTFIAEEFNPNYSRGVVPAENLRAIFRKPQISLYFRGPIDSGHADWKAIKWYQEQGITTDEPFVVEIDVDYLINYIKKYFHWSNQ